MASKRADQRWTEEIRILCMAVTGVLLISGCTTPSQRISQAEIDQEPIPDPAPVITVSDEARDRAHALALFARAQIHELNRQPEQAIAAYRQALLFSPDSEPLFLRLALSLIRANRLDEAAEVFRMVAEQQPERAQPLLWQGAMYRQRDRIEEAERLYRAGLEREPDHPQAFLYLYELLIQQGRQLDALLLLEEAVERVAEPAPFYQLLGELHVQRSVAAESEADQIKSMAAGIAAWEQARELAPEQAVPWATLGGIYLQKQDLERAARYFREAIRLDPTMFEAMERLVLIYELTHRPVEAVEILEAMAGLQPTNARIFLALGAMYEQLGRTADALRSYRTASQLGRPTPSTYLKLAVLQMEDDPKQAIADLQDGLALIPGNPRMLEMLGIIAFHETDYETALSALAAAELHWQEEDERGEAFTAHAPIYLALSHYFTGNLESAADRLLRAMTVSPIALEAFLYFVIQDEDEERAREIADFIAPLLQDQPDHVPALIALGYLFSFNKDHDAALAAFERAYLVGREQEQREQWLDSRFFFWYAAAHERLDLHDKAEELFYRALELDPDSAETLNYLAYMWAELDRNLEKAEEYVQIALAARPDSAAFIDTLGWVYYRQGRYDEAYTEIRRAAELLPDDPVITDHLGDIYLALGLPEQAIAHWQKALELDPENPAEILDKLAAAGVTPPTGDTIEDLELDADEAPDETTTDTAPDQEPESEDLD